MFDKRADKVRSFQIGSFLLLNQFAEFVIILVLDDLKGKSAGGAEFLKILVRYLCGRNDVKPVIVDVLQKLPVFYVQNFMKFHGTVPGFAAQVQHQRNNGLQLVVFFHAGQEFRAVCHSDRNNALFTRQFRIIIIAGIIIISGVFGILGFLPLAETLDIGNLSRVTQGIIKHVPRCHAVMNFALKLQSQEHKHCVLVFSGTPELQKVAMPLH